ncbi:MAG: radical SAM protein [Candidatus Diapherotrites archaeon]
MKILLLNPPFLKKFSRTSRSPGVSKGGCVYYPLWLAYAAGVLEKEGHEVKLIDAPAQNMELEEVVAAAKEFSPELVVLDTSTPSIYSDVKCLEGIKKAVKCFAVLVGTHVSALPKESLELSKEIDAIARHEYDYILRDLANAFEEGTDWRGVRGLTFRSNGAVQGTPDMHFIEKLDDLPFVSAVYRNHLNYKNYFYPANLYPEITIITGRGCPFQCTYCVMPQAMNGRRYRYRSVENVLRELKYIKENFPDVKEVFIEDDTLTANRQRVKELCDKIVAEKLKIRWSCNARADVDLETLQKMRKAGCRLLCVGFESGSQEILDNIKKGTKLEVIRQFMKDAKKAGILVHGCFMMGNQGETKETIGKTVKFAVELEPDSAQFFPIMVYPGTEAFDFFRKNGFITTDNFREWLKETGEHNCIVSRPGLSNEDLVKECDNARRVFYLRPKYLGKKLLQGITNPKELPRLVKASGTFSKYLLKRN